MSKTNESNNQFPDYWGSTSENTTNGNGNLKANPESKPKKRSVEGNTKPLPIGNDQKTKIDWSKEINPVTSKPFANAFEYTAYSMMMAQSPEFVAPTIETIQSNANIEKLVRIRTQEKLQEQQRQVELNHLSRDAQFVIGMINTMSVEELKTFVNKNEFLDFLKAFGHHATPKSKSLANEHILSKLNKHTMTARGLSLLSAFCSASAFTTITSVVIQNNVGLAKAAGVVLGLGTYGLMQKALKEDLIDTSEYAQNRLRDEYDTVQKEPKSNWLKDKLGQGEDMDTNSRNTHYRVKSIKDLIGRRRLLASLGVTGMIALSATTMALIELPEKNKDAIYKYNERALIKDVADHAQKDEDARASIMLIQKQISIITSKITAGDGKVDLAKLSEQDQTQYNKLNEDLAKALKQNSAFAFYSEQVSLEAKKVRCTTVLSPKNGDGSIKEISPNTRNSSDYQTCAVFNDGEYVKGGTRGVPKYETLVNGGTLNGRVEKGLKERISEAGGEYKEGELPLTKAMKDKQDFESIRSSKPELTLIKYWEKMGQTPEEKNKGKELVASIKSGKWLDEEKEFGVRLKIGIDRMFDDLGGFHVPAEIAAALIILIIESISIVNTSSLLADDQFKRIWFNRNLQQWGHGYNADLADAVITELKKSKTNDGELNLALDQILETVTTETPTSNQTTNLETPTALVEPKIAIKNSIDNRSWKDRMSGVKSESEKTQAIAQANEIRESLNSLQIRDIIQYYAVHGKLPGQQTLVKNYLAGEFEAMERVIDEAEKEKAKIAAAVVLTDTKILALQVGADAEKTASEITLDVTTNKLSMAGQQQNAIERELQIKDEETKKIQADKNIADHRETKRETKAKAKIDEGSWWDNFWGK